MLSHSVFEFVMQTTSISIRIILDTFLSLIKKLLKIPGNYIIRGISRGLYIPEDLQYLCMDCAILFACFAI